MKMFCSTSQVTELIYNQKSCTLVLWSSMNNVDSFQNSEKQLCLPSWRCIFTPFDKLQRLSHSWTDLDAWHACIKRCIKGIMCSLIKIIPAFRTFECWLCWVSAGCGGGRTSIWSHWAAARHLPEPRAVLQPAPHRWEWIFSQQAFCFVVAETHRKSKACIVSP